MPLATLALLPHVVLRVVAVEVFATAKALAHAGNEIGEGTALASRGSSVYIVAVSEMVAPAFFGSAVAREMPD